MTLKQPSAESFFQVHKLLCLWGLMRTEEVMPDDNLVGKEFLDELGIEESRLFPNNGAPDLRLQGALLVLWSVHLKRHLMWCLQV